jgi:Uncharacterized protein conserved in bacteria (DUF2066)
MAVWRLRCGAWAAGGLAILLAFTLTSSFWSGAQAADSLYAVARLSVDITANDAVAARERGMAEAEQRAVKIVLKRLVPLSAYASLPELGKENVETMIDGVSIRSEQNSTTRYLAVLDISVNERAVKQFLRDQGVHYSETRPSSVSILPLVLDGGSVKSEGAEGWRQAWNDLDLSHSVTPATILKPGPNLDAAMVKAVLGGDARALTSMQEDYGYGPLVIAVGQVDSGKFVTRLAGADNVGAINYGRTDASIAFGILENRWKMTQEGEAPTTAVKYEEGAPGTAETPKEGVEVPRNVVAEVEFSGLKDWQDMRGRLISIAGIQALEVNSLSARSASVTFDYAGSLGRLQAELGKNGLVLDQKDGNFVLRSR